MLTILCAILFLASLGIAGAVTQGAAISLLIPAVLCQAGVWICLTLKHR